MNKYIVASALSVGLAVTLAATGYTQGQSQQRVQAQDRSAQARADAKERVEVIKLRVEEKRETVKQDVCERKQDRLNVVVPRLAERSARLQAVIDRMYERVEGFYDSGQLSVTNYEELKADVEASQQASNTAVLAVESFTIEIDCDSPSVGQQLSGVREANTQARDALKEYRASLVQLISAMRAEASQDQSDDSEDETIEQPEEPEGSEPPEAVELPEEEPVETEEPIMEDTEETRREN